MSKGAADNYNEKTAIYKHREWRGWKDTCFDFGQWCVLWGILIKWVFSHLLQNIKAIFRYRWMFSYLTVPSFFDRLCSGQRGAGLRAARYNLNYLASDVTGTLTTIFSASQASLATVLRFIRRVTLRYLSSLIKSPHFKK